MGDEPPGLRLELVDGQVAVSPSPGLGQSYATLTLVRFPGATTSTGASWANCSAMSASSLANTTLRRADIIFFAKDRLHLIGEQAMEGAPDLCVEVISPGSMHIDRADKFAQYAAGGVAHYWIVDPQKRTLEGYKLIDRRYVSSGHGRGPGRRQPRAISRVEDPPGSPLAPAELARHCPCSLVVTSGKTLPER